MINDKSEQISSNVWAVRIEVEKVNGKYEAFLFGADPLLN